MKKFLILIIIFFDVNISLATVQYWNMPTTADNIVFGQGCLIQSETPQGLKQNPATLGLIKYRSFSASGIQWWQGIYGGSVGSVMPAGKYGTVSLNLGCWSLGSIAEISNNGQPLGPLQPQASNISCGYGVLLMDNWGVGVDIKSSRFDLMDQYEWGWSTDIGFSFRQGNYIGSIMARDLGPDYPKNNFIRDPLNSSFIIGTKGCFLDGLITGSLQYNAFKEGKSYPGLSFTITPLPAISLKIGYEKDPALEDRSPLGLGVEIRKLGHADLNVSYGYRSYAELGDAQSISMGIIF